MINRKQIKIGIVEDDIYYNKTLLKYIQSICDHYQYGHLDFKLQSFLNAHDCIEELEDNTDILILDYYLINKDEDEILNGSDVIREISQYNPNCKIIIISSLQDGQKTVELMRSGIFDYIDKNVNSKNRLGAIIQKALKENSRSI